ncbi:DUF6904 family protein [Lentibacillus amyloliquefaciens]|uniref:Uncharacterized protein n=1 Tax=Lentibacillus amyloliquefaciens TaxID=1472767 RepID=A0A0U3WJK3_9BACI|nr:hypothetical protein [Lentibacillus amyloliquefaciens]ALX50031.1 hypothetical protein AOX59_16460 [Lentibacillus amyloliquefaciens]
MLKAEHTPNYAGITLYGDFHDFEQLYEALHDIVGEEGEHPPYEEVRLYILSFCYYLRHAFMGHRESAFVDNGMTEDTMKFMNIAGSTKNIYFSFNTLYPQMLFTIGALNDFIRIRGKKLKHPALDRTITTLRQLQAAVIQSLEETLSQHAFKMMMNNMNHWLADFGNYYVQYIDQLNIRFIEWDKEKRKKNISVMAKRIFEKGKEYQSIKQEIDEVAREENVPVSEIHFAGEYPEEIDW